MKIKLTVEERAFALLAPRGVRGDLNEIRKALQALDALEFTDGEVEEFGITEMPGGGLRWAEEMRHELTTIEIKPPNLRWLVKKVKEFGNWPPHPCIPSMFERLEAARKDAEEEGKED